MELGMTIDAMKESSARMSHQELFDATTEMIRIGKYNFAKNSTEHNTIHSLMNNIMNLYLSRPSTSSRKPSVRKQERQTASRAMRLIFVLINTNMFRRTQTCLWKPVLRRARSRQCCAERQCSARRVQTPAPS